MAIQLRMGGRKQKSDPNYWLAVNQSIEYCVANKGLKHLLIYADKVVERYISVDVRKTFIEPFINKRGKFARVKQSLLDTGTRNY